MEKGMLLVPDNTVPDWKKTRKTQWRYVRATLQALNFTKSDIKDYKNDYIHGCENDPGVEFDLEPEPFLGIWFCADQTPEKQQEIWDKSMVNYGRNFKRQRDVLLRLMHEGVRDETEFQSPYGAFGGFEKVFKDLLIRSDVYTDDTFTINNKEYRKLPWESPGRTNSAIISKISSYFDGEYGVFCPSQWCHDLFISTFQYDIEYDDSSNEYCFKRLKRSLLDKPYWTAHENHIIAAHKLIDILEDESAPKRLRYLWQQVKNNKED